MALSPDLLLKEFSTKERSYIFCGRTKQVFLVNPIMLKILPVYAHLSLDDIQHRLKDEATQEQIAKSYGIVDRMARDNGFFRGGGLTVRARVPQDEIIRREVGGNIEQMCLEVTTGCNFRCHYCTYSGGYERMREHGARPMAEDTAKAAIDFLFEKNRERRDPFHLSFYGGEPLTQLPLIEFCVEYAKSLQWCRPEALGFNVTTNGALLDERSIRFLVENRFSILVSLYGPAEDHDAHRVSAGGEATFSTVISNLLLLRQIAPDYPTVSVNCVLSTTTDLLRVNEFFVQTRALFRRVNVSSVSPGHRSFFKQYPRDSEKYRGQNAKLFQLYIDAHLQPGPAIPERPELTFVRSLFEKDFLMLHTRKPLGRAASEFDVTASCFPGKRKLFVDASGSFHVCERTDTPWPLGDVRAGFDVPAMKGLFEKYILLMNRADCLNCWAFFFCPVCFANAGDGSQLTLDRESICTRFRDTLGTVLSAYCHILEHNPDAFKYMDSYDVG